MIEYSQAQEDYRDKTKVMIQRQLQITTGKHVSERDVDEIVEKGSLQVFTQDVSVANTCMGVWLIFYFADIGQYFRAATGIR